MNCSNVTATHGGGYDVRRMSCVARLRKHFALMPVAIDSAPFGMEVPPAQISRELKKLWERDSGVSTRASLINFAVYCEGVEAMRRNTELIMTLTRHHACRAILIGFEPNSDTAQVRAWINAHCHLSHAGAKQVCCEQVSFLFEGATRDRITNMLFSNLDSDLPLYFWWQGNFTEEIDEQLWAWVDRLIYDSQCWSEPEPQFAFLHESLERSSARLTLCDLNWTRSLHMRQAIAQMFDHPENLAILHGLQQVRIEHAPGYQFTALLLAGWFAAQLDLVLTAFESDVIHYQHREGNPVRIALQAQAGRSISRCELSSDDGSIDVQRDAAGNFFRVKVQLSPERVYQHLLPAGDNATESLLLEEIATGGRHRVYLKALAFAREIPSTMAARAGCSA
jgi:glucose-6-phosphate dehydrogenase assembly protein OpcA